MQLFNKVPVAKACIKFLVVCHICTYFVVLFSILKSRCMLIPENKWYLIQNSQAVKKECGPEKGYGEKRCEIQGGGQEMAVMVG